MNKKLNQFFYLLKEQFGLFLSISFGVFLFILFFQPFPLDHFDFNNKLIFVAGLGAIVFLFIVLVRIPFSWLFRYDTNPEEKVVFPHFMSGFFILSLTSVAFAFYLRYVGEVNITFYVMFKVALICLASPVILKIYDSTSELKDQNILLLKEKKIIQKQVEKYEEDYLNKSIEFFSESGTESLTLQVSEVAFIRSADNYVEIVYQEAGVYKKKLIRNTLKNIELQIKSYSNFIRCHRICIVNSHFIEKLNRNFNSHFLTLKNYNEQLPVSRQYLLKLKEMI